MILLDIRGFAASALPGNERGFALFAHAAQILQLFPVLSDMTEDTRQRYNAWLDECVLSDLQLTPPEIITWLVDQCRALVAHSSQLPVETLVD